MQAASDRASATEQRARCDHGAERRTPRQTAAAHAAQPSRAHGHQSAAGAVSGAARPRITAAPPGESAAKYRGTRVRAITASSSLHCLSFADPQAGTTDNRSWTAGVTGRGRSSGRVAIESRDDRRAQRARMRLEGEDSVNSCGGVWVCAILDYRIAAVRSPSIFLITLLSHRRRSSSPPPPCSRVRRLASPSSFPFSSPSV